VVESITQRMRYFVEGDTPEEACDAATGTDALYDEHYLTERKVVGRKLVGKPVPVYEYPCEDDVALKN